jgi:NAD(P)-dependent dehydrogenase (short-subunit alcohol dehydrogenase family)
VTDLDGQVVVVTGGSRGIGRAIVTGAVGRGAKVAFCARDLEPAAEVVAEAEAIGGPGCALAVRADVAVEADVEALFDQTLDRFGQVDVAIHNAGLNRDQLMVQSEVALFDEVLAVNLTGAFLVVRRAVQEFLAGGTGGRIVLVGSLSDRGITSQTAYAASKGGLRGLARTVAKEYAHKGITANVVIPGLIDTAMTAGLPPALRALGLAAPLRRAGQPSEVASVALYLASARAGFLHGETVYASGGLAELNR